MSTLTTEQPETVQALGVRFQRDRLTVELSDGREIGVPYRKLPWLSWLATATREERESWSIEPGGYAVYWVKLDDGIEVCHLLALQNLD